MKIKKVTGREILDSRGCPTVECTLELDSGSSVVASVPSGASVGRYEAKELRDNQPERFEGKGVLQAVGQLECQIAPLLIGKAPDVVGMDAAMIDLDDTPDKSRLGANATLAASIAVTRAQALVHGIELYELINKLWGFPAPTLPVCMFNIINGGLHADSRLLFQEFMVMPQQGNFKDRLQVADRIYHELKKLLHEKHYATAVGDEGGFAPSFGQEGILRELAALDLLQQTCQLSEVENVSFCLDVAASCFYDSHKKIYCVYGAELSSEQMIDVYQNLCQTYPIASLEDGLDQDDWHGWQNLTRALGQSIQLVGDDLFVTHAARINQGIEKCVANAVLIKPNQIGTVSETVAAIQVCQKCGYKTIVSHRSGETNDTFIADLAVGCAAGQLKAGAPVRGERVAKYNRLLAIEDRLERG
jgi:enolase